MGLEVATFISELNANNPVGATDAKSQGDDHLRLIKTTLLNTLPNITGAMNASHTELNNLVGVTGATGTGNIVLSDSPVFSGSINGSLFTDLNASNLSSGTVPIARIDETLINHDNLLNFVLNEHINHSGVLITAGDGLTGGGSIAISRELNVGEGDGISVTASAVSVDSTVARTNVDEVFNGTVTIEDEFITSGIRTETSSSAVITELNTVNVTIIRLTGDPQFIGGLSNGVPGKRITLMHLGIRDFITLSNEDAGAVAADRIRSIIDGSVSVLFEGGAIDLIYDGVSNRWQVIRSWAS